MSEMPDLDLEDKHLEEAVCTAIGAASACWGNLSGAGIFESDRAKNISDQLLARIRNEMNYVIDAEPNIESELASLLNKYSAESVSGTPDFILAHYLINCLKNYNEAVSRRAEWRGELTDFRPTVEG